MPTYLQNSNTLHNSHRIYCRNKWLGNLIYTFLTQYCVVLLIIIINLY